MSSTENEPDPLKIGKLYVVATPIGNRGDLSSRAIEILSKVDFIACENTRRAQRLLSPLGIKTPSLRYFEGNEQPAALSMVRRMADHNIEIALITEAGTPGISDPGFRVVRECHKRNIPVLSVPGANAAVSALSVSGLPTDGFFFIGFLPPRKSSRRLFFQKYRDFPHSIVLYESTHRIHKFLEDLEAVLGPDRVICLARELTKIHETVLTGSVLEVTDRLNRSSSKGEFVVIVAKEGYRV